MDKVSSRMGKELYKAEILSPTGNQVIADEPLDKGGKDLGLSPKELLIAALAACTSATVRMYADRKQWDLQEVKVNIEMERDEEQNKTFITRKVEFIGNLGTEQRDRLFQIANKCPVHKILSNPIAISTTAS
jgi:putative redox protein